MLSRFASQLKELKNNGKWQLLLSFLGKKNFKVDPRYKFRTLAIKWNHFGTKHQNYTN